MAKSSRTAFDPARFNPERTWLPPVTADPAIDGCSDLVIGLLSKGSELSLLGYHESIGDAVGMTYAQAMERLVAEGASAKRGSLTLLPGKVRLIAVGLGDEPDLSPEDLRRGAAHGVRAASTITTPDGHVVAISLDTDSTPALQAIAEGALLACHTFCVLGAKAQPRPIAALRVVTRTDQALRALERAVTVATSVVVARDWSDMPPNLLGPADLVAQARGFLAGEKIEIEVLDEKALKKGGYNGILAVGGGSVRPPRLLRADYHPKGATRHLALVGKGITYDSGGYNLKPGDSLITMKHDMAGSAAVITAIRAIARLGLNLHVTAYAPIAEQMISGEAYRPSDVLTMLDGTTVENMNSDCEGRIVLADALVRASRDNPDMIVDIATLTGTCVLALGHSVAGLMTSDDASADAVLDAAEDVGEDFWQLPITDEVRDNLPSDFADIQSKGERQGGALFAAAFLQHFVAGDVGWAHLDIAGPAWNTKSATHYLSKNSTGFGIRTLIRLAENLATD